MKKNIKTAVILAAGRGTRLRPYTHDIPKGFIKVGGESLIERSIRILKENGIEQIIIGTGHLKEHYEALAQKAGLVTFLNQEYASTGSFHTLCCGQGLIKDDFLLLESDLLYHSEAIQKLIETPKEDVILCSGFTQSNDEVYVESTQDGLLKNLSKDKKMLGYVSAELVGIWKISYQLFQKLLVHHEKAYDARTKDYELAIAELSPQYPVRILKIDDLVWCEIDNEAHLERAKTDIFPRLRQA